MAHVYCTVTALPRMTLHITPLQTKQHCAKWWLGRYVFCCSTTMDAIYTASAEAAASCIPMHCASSACSCPGSSLVGTSLVRSARSLASMPRSLQRSSTTSIPGEHKQQWCIIDYSHGGDCSGELCCNCRSNPAHDAVLMSTCPNHTHQCSHESTCSPL